MRNETIEKETGKTDSYAREKRIWPDGPKEELHHKWSRKLCENWQKQTVRKVKTKRNNQKKKKTKKQKKKEGATILDLSSFFLLSPSHLENLDNLNIIDRTGQSIYIIG